MCVVSAVATATSAGPVNIAQAVTLRYLGRIASGYTPSFQWSIPPAGSLSGMTCTYTGPTVSYTNSTCTIPANTLTAGASAPETLVDEIVAAFRDRFDVTLEVGTTARENMYFPLPRELRPLAEA